MKKRRLKKAFTMVMTTILVCSIFVVSASAQEVDFHGNQFKDRTTDATLRSSVQDFESVTAVPGEFFGPKIMSFNGNRLTASGNATVKSGSVSSITIRLKKQVLGGIYRTVTESTLYANGNVQNLFRDVVISPNVNYRFTYQVNGSAEASADVFVAAASWTY